MNEKIDELKHGLVVSCQADDDSPLNSPFILSRMAMAAELGGACGIRADKPQNIKEIKNVVSIPIIGIYKRKYKNSKVYITPTWREAKEVIESGADILALDATFRKRPGRFELKELIDKIKSYSSIPIIADVATFDQAKMAMEYGADMIATTLLGYTEETAKREVPDLNLIRKMSNTLKVTVVAEGGIRLPDEAHQAIKAGAEVVVVGTAITDITWITGKFAEKFIKPLDLHK